MLKTNKQINGSAGKPAANLDSMSPKPGTHTVEHNNRTNSNLLSLELHMVNTHTHTF